MQARATTPVPQQRNFVVFGASLADLLILFRAHRGWSRLEVSRRIGVDNSSIGLYEAGKRVPSGWIVAEYISIFDLDFDESEVLIAAWQIAMGLPSHCVHLATRS